MTCKTKQHLGDKNSVQIVTFNIRYWMSVRLPGSLDHSPASLYLFVAHIKMEKNSYWKRVLPCVEVKKTSTEQQHQDYGLICNKAF